MRLPVQPRRQGLPRSARQKFDQLVEYVRNLSESEKQQYFTKEGMRDYSGLLELHIADSRPHGMARFLLPAPPLEHVASARQTPSGSGRPRPELGIAGGRGHRDRV